MDAGAEQKEQIKQHDDPNFWKDGPLREIIGGGITENTRETSRARQRRKYVAANDPKC